MKISLLAIIAASIMTVPVVALAQQSDTGLTRAQIRAELVQLEKAGYNPSRGQDPYYPADVQAATTRLQATNPVPSDVATSGYGGNAGGAPQTGRHTAAHNAERSIYFGR